MRAALYARVSTVDKDQNPETQLRILRAHATARGWSVTGDDVDHASAADLRGRVVWREDTRPAPAKNPKKFHNPHANTDTTTIKKTPQTTEGRREYDGPTVRSNFRSGWATVSPAIRAGGKMRTRTMGFTPTARTTSKVATP